MVYPAALKLNHPSIKFYKTTGIECNSPALIRKAAGIGLYGPIPAEK